MADPTQNPSGSSAAGDSTGNNLAQVIAQAVATAVTSSIQELTNKLNQIDQNLKNTSTNEDTSMEVSTVGNDDAFIGLRNERVAQSGMQVQLLRLTAASVDHFIEANKASVASLAAIGTQAGRHADVAVARHWGTSPETANPTAPTPKA